MKKVTIELEPELHRRLKVVAASEDYSVKEIVTGLIDNWVGRKESEISERLRREDARGASPVQSSDEASG
jgi:predicted transcriptional regulator